MLEVAAQIIICLILAALIGGIIGFILGKATCKQESCQEESVSTHELHIDHNGISIAEAPSMVNSTANKAKSDKPEMPLLLTEAREGGKDNLQRIKGVGNVLESVLNETGIYHFDQIANLTPNEIKWLDNSMDFPGRIDREEWVAQAKELAAGGETEYTQRIERGEVTIPSKSD